MSSHVTRVLGLTLTSIFLILLASRFSVGAQTDTVKPEGDDDLLVEHFVQSGDSWSDIFAGLTAACDDSEVASFTVFDSVLRPGTRFDVCCLRYSWFWQPIFCFGLCWGMQLYLGWAFTRVSRGNFKLGGQ